MHVISPYLSVVVSGSEYQVMKDELRTKFSDIYIQYENGQKMVDKRVVTGRLLLPVKDIPGIKRIYPELVLPDYSAMLPDGKIPGAYVATILNFYREICVRNNASLEAKIDILWSKDKGYFFALPDQTVSAGHISHKNNHITPGCVRIVDTHSHGDMGAFFSGTDDKDDKERIGYSVVYGHVSSKTHKPEIVIRMNMDQGQNVKVNLTDVFSDIIDKSSIPQVEESWFSKVSVGTDSAIAGEFEYYYGAGGYRGWGNENRNKGSKYSYGGHGGYGNYGRQWKKPEDSAKSNPYSTREVVEGMSYHEYEGYEGYGYYGDSSLAAGERAGSKKNHGKGKNKKDGAQIYSYGKKIDTPSSILAESLEMEGDEDRPSEITSLSDFEKKGATATSYGSYKSFSKKADEQKEEEKQPWKKLYERTSESTSSLQGKDVAAVRKAVMKLNNESLSNFSDGERYAFYIMLLSHEISSIKENIRDYLVRATALTCVTNTIPTGATPAEIVETIENMPERGVREVLQGLFSSQENISTFIDLFAEDAPGSFGPKAERPRNERTPSAAYLAFCVDLISAVPDEDFVLYATSKADPDSDAFTEPANIKDISTKDLVIAPPTSLQSSNEGSVTGESLGIWGIDSSQK